MFYLPEIRMPFKGHLKVLSSGENTQQNAHKFKMNFYITRQNNK